MWKEASEFMNAKQKIIRNMALTLAIIAVVCVASVYAVTSFYYTKTVHAILEIEIDGQVTPISMDIVSGTIVVTLQPNPSTVAAHTYIINLYLDNVLSGSNTISWTAAEITALTTKSSTFIGIVLTGVTQITAEVTG